ncbi:MAG: hypothetical protein AB1Z19_04915, partial [Eubacteriales bacterium]
MKTIKRKRIKVVFNIIQIISGIITIVETAIIVKNYNFINTPLTLSGSIIVFFAVIIFILSFVIKSNAEVFEIINRLSDIQKTCIESGIVKFTTLKNILTNSPENDLSYGSIVKVLTSHLSSFDTSKNAVKMISNNLKSGARYQYYLPNNEKV